MEHVGVQVEESAGRVVPTAEVPLELRCADCGYGAVVHRVVPLCPMCSGTVWELRRPVARRLVD